MLVKHRGILAIVGAITLSVVSVAVGVQIHSWMYGLPEAATADRDGLLRWLVIADLSDYDDATCRKLVNRFEEVFADEQNVGGDASSLSAEQHARVSANVERLKEVWFHARVNEYLALATENRAAFLDRQIRNIFRCAAIDRQFHAGSESPLSTDERNPVGGDFLGSFFTSLDQWKESEPEAKRAQISGVVKDGLIRWLATDDLAAYSASSRQHIIANLEGELGDKLSFGDSAAGLSARDSKQFWKNVEVLAEAWFHHKAAEFGALPRADRRAFVNRQLAVVGELAAHWPSSANGGAADIAMRLQRWISTADSKDRPAAQEFAGALQAAWLARAFGASF